MQRGVADVGSAVGIVGNFGEQPFELALANSFEIGAVGTLGRGFVKINRNFVAVPDFTADLFGQGHAVFDGNTFHRDKGDDVGGAHARVRAGMFGEVDELGGFADAAQGGFGDRFGFAGQGHDAAVVIGIAFAIENVDAGDFAHGGDDGVNLGDVAAFGKIRNTLDDALHRVRTLPETLGFFGVDDGAALHGQGTKGHAKIIRVFARVGHVKGGEISKLATLERTAPVVNAQAIAGITGGSSDGSGASHAHLGAGPRKNHGHAEGRAGAGIEIGGKAEDGSGVDESARGGVIFTARRE